MTTNNINNENISLLNVIIKYLHNWKVFLGTFIFSIIVAILYLIFYFTTFEGEVKMQLVNDENTSVGNMLGDMSIMKSLGMNKSSGAINVDDELLIIGSQATLQELALTLGLNVTYSYPALFPYELYETNPLIITADSVTFAQLERGIGLKVKINPGKIAVNVKIKNEKEELFTFTSLPALIKTRYGEYTLDYSGKITAPESFSMDITIEPSSWTAEKLISQIDIDSESKNSEIIYLEYQDYERQRVKDILNTLVALYNKYSTKIKKQDGEKSLVFYNDRLTIIYDELINAEIKIESYKSKHYYTDLESDVKLYTSQLSEMDKNIILLETDLYGIELLEDFIKNPDNKYNLVPSLIESKNSGGGGGDVSPALIQYNNMLLERDRVLEQSYENSAIVLSYNSQLESLRKNVTTTIKNTKESLVLSLKNLKKKETELYSKIGGIPSYEKEYTESKRQQEIYQTLYLFLLQKREEVALSIGEEKDKGRSLYPAIIKKKTVAPRKLYAAIGILLFTLIFPIGFIFCKEQYVALKEKIKADNMNA